MALFIWLYKDNRQWQGYTADTAGVTGVTTRTNFDFTVVLSCWDSWNDGFCYQLQVRLLIQCAFLRNMAFGLETLDRIPLPWQTARVHLNTLLLWVMTCHDLSPSPIMIYYVIYYSMNYGQFASVTIVLPSEGVNPWSRASAGLPRRICSSSASLTKLSKLSVQYTSWSLTLTLAHSNTQHGLPIISSLQRAMTIWRYLKHPGQSGPVRTVWSDATKTNAS